MDIIYLVKSPFSLELHGRSNTSLQFRLNHFSTLAKSVNLSLFATGASGSITLLVRVSPEALGFSV